MSGKTRSPDQQRKIIHIDMDAFYASVEQRDFPHLKGKPIAVGGGENRGVTTTASYEARKFGVRSAMPGYKAKQLCPQLIFMPPRFDVYKQVSDQIRSVFRNYTDIIEPLSFDEAFLDVTENKKGEEIATYLAQAIKTEIKAVTELSCSAGVSYCKFLAKVASDMNKPDGLTVIKPHQAEAFLEELPISKFFGVGKVTGRKMAALGIEFGKDLKKWSRFDLVERFGKAGSFYYDIVRGIDERPVKAERVRKSLGVERTLDEDLAEMDDILPVLERLIDLFFKRLQKADNFGRTITLKLKTHEFQTLTRSQSRNYFVKDQNEIRTIAIQLLESNMEAFEKIRLIGLTASNLEDELEDDAQMAFDF
ncbi:MAG: DNA polymerase IV [Saprospiraceae bacterium]|nr:DNA polymerase IV [Saprospiraceae bacterium]